MSYLSCYWLFTLLQCKTKLSRSYKTQLVDDCKGAILPNMLGTFIIHKLEIPSSHNEFVEYRWVSNICLTLLIWFLDYTYTWWTYALALTMAQLQCSCYSSECNIGHMISQSQVEESKLQDPYRIQRTWLRTHELRRHRRCLYQRHWHHSLLTCFHVCM